MTSTSPLLRLPDISPDPIFTAAQRAKHGGSDAINGTIGVVLSERGELLLLPSVREAIATIDSTKTEYPPLAGLPAYLDVVKKLTFDTADVAAVASVGGTGALSMLLHLAKHSGYQSVILPTPTWANHQRIISSAGLKIAECAYLENGTPTFAPLIAIAEETTEPCILLLQASCHNPTGRDPSKEQWQEVADALADTPHAVLLDFAYQGLGDGIEEDRESIRMFSNADIPLLVSWSASKNHCLYGLRTGAAFMSIPGDTNLAQQHLSMMSRSLVSVAPIIGQKIVATVQAEHADEWNAELTILRTLLAKKRQMLADALPQFAQLILSSKGLFLQLPLTEQQIELLTSKKVFLTPDGRINIAGISLNRIKEIGIYITQTL